MPLHRVLLAVTLALPAAALAVPGAEANHMSWGVVQAAAP